ncbi:lamin tail domain-containing protein [Candidatus Pacearchaeota archaeon]|nr:lamin tail domain-containing protein [Candidatus Pacearchaeota archaeon]
MKKFILLFIFILFIGGISAIRINEIEINPGGIDGENEWIELYNDEPGEKDVSGWEIWEGIYGSSGPKIITTIPEGIIITNNKYYIVSWEGTKLNNNGDFVILYDSFGNKIDETKTLKESSSSTKTWQLCEIWEFKESTKGEKNNCEEHIEETEEENKETSETIEDTIVQDDSVEESPTNYKTPIQSHTIELTKNIKSENNTKEKDKSVYAKYGFIVFCVLLGVLLILKKNKHRKNEFGQ